jgi:hypothetical protein
VSDLLEELKKQRRLTHDRLLTLVTDLTDVQMSWLPGAKAPAIGFHLWHTARWSDVDRSLMGGGEELWKAKGLAESWGLGDTALGHLGTGMGIGDDASQLLALPPKEVLVAYAEASYKAFDAFLATVTPGDLRREWEDGSRRTGEIAVLMHHAHDNRHLGMVEALRGLLGLRGSATD